MELIHNRHSVGGSNYHLQFTPKYRRCVFRIGRLRRYCEALLRKKAYGLGLKIEAIEFGPNHLHIFISGCRRYSVSYIVNQLKGYTSRLIRKNLPEDVLPFLWGDSFWSDGFFYESIGRVTTETIKFYIERQQGKHWEPAEREPSFSFAIPKAQTTLQQFGA